MTETRCEHKESILNAADTLLQRYGYKKMTVDDIAREAGVGKGTVYLYFPSKEEVALCSIDRVNLHLQQRLRDIANGTGSESDRLRQILKDRVLYRFDQVKHSSDCLDELFAAIRPALMLRRELYFEAEAQILADVLISGRDKGIFSFDDALECAHLMLTATNSLLPYSLSPRQLGARDELAVRVEGIANLLLVGIQAR